MTAIDGLIAFHRAPLSLEKAHVTLLGSVGVQFCKSDESSIIHTISCREKKKFLLIETESRSMCWMGEEDENRLLT